MHIGWTLMLVAGLASQPAPDPAPDAAATEDAKPRCAEDVASAEAAVRAVFADLTEAYRAQLPGPRGEAIRARAVDRIVRRTVDVDEFAEKSLGSAWEQVDEAQRLSWRAALAGMLLKRYWHRLQDPTPYLVEDTTARLECDHAEVRVMLRHKRSQERRDLIFALVYRDPDWRLYDVSVDGTSLLQTWRGRFRRIHLDGGIGSLDEQMLGLKKRYPCPEEGCKL